MPLECLASDLTPTGLHYLVAHFDIPLVDASTWRVELAGELDRPLSLSMDDLRSRPARTAPVTLECAGNGRTRMENRAESQPWLLEAVSTAEWTGTPLAGLLEEAGLGSGVVELVFTGADHGVQGGIEQDYQRSLTVAEAMRPEVLLAYAMNGHPLEPQHGAPVRLLVPGWYGMTSVKWLRRIEAVTRPFEGYQQADSYRVQLAEDDPGERVTRIKVRALMAPPGFGQFPSGDRIVDAGPVVLRGKAWCGTAPVARVDVGIDDRWQPAELGPDRGPPRVAVLGLDLAGGARPLCPLVPRHRCRRQDPAAGAVLERPGHGQHLRPDHRRQRPLIATRPGAGPPTRHRPNRDCGVAHFD